MPEPAPHLEPPRSSVPSRAGDDLIGALAVRVESLVERYRAAREQLEDLRARLAEREKRIRELEKRAEAAGRARRDVARRIDGLITEVARLERG